MSKILFNFLLIISLLIPFRNQADPVKTYAGKNSFLPLESNYHPDKTYPRSNWVRLLASSRFNTNSLSSDEPKDNDPIRFMLIPSKEEIALGEEFEIKIIAELMNIHPSAMFSFEGSNAYSIKVVLPEGFIQTGGDYTDFISETLLRSDPIRQYTIRGKFIRMPSAAYFDLIRGPKGATNGSTFALKKSLVINVYNPETSNQIAKKSLGDSQLENIYTPKKKNELNLATNANCQANVIIVRDSIFCGQGMSTLPALVKANNCQLNTIEWSYKSFQYDYGNITKYNGIETLEVTNPGWVSLKCTPVNCSTSFQSQEYIIYSNQPRLSHIILYNYPSCEPNTISIFSAQTCATRLGMFTEKVGNNMPTVNTFVANSQIIRPDLTAKYRLYFGECIDDCGNPLGGSYYYRIPAIPTSKDFVVKVTTNDYFQNPPLLESKSGQNAYLTYSGNSSLSIYTEGCIEGKVYVDGIESPYFGVVYDQANNGWPLTSDYIRKSVITPQRQYIEITCKNICGESTAKIFLGQQSANGFKLYTEKTQVCVGDSATISALGCQNGTLQWSSNVNVRSNPAIVKPTTATWYSATCTINGIVTKDSVRIQTLALPTAKPGISAKNLKNNATASAQTGQTTMDFPFEYGTSIQLSASSCPAGNTYAWYNNQTGKQTDTGNSITVQPSAQTQYWAKCVNQTGCEGPSSTAVQTNPLATDIKASINGGTNPVVICSESQSLQSLLTTTGCGGEVKWYIDDQDGNRLNDIQVTSLANTKPNKTTYYYATCSFAGKELSVSNTVQVIVPSASVAFDAGSKSVVCQGIPVTLVAKGCHETGTLNWFKKSGTTSVAVTDPTSRVGEISFINVTPEANTLYFAKCQIGSCTSESSTLEVQVMPKSQAKPRVRVGTVSADMSKEITVCLDKSFELFVENPSINDKGYVWQAPNGGKTFGDPADKSKGLSVPLTMQAAYAGRWTLLIYDNCSNVPIQQTFELKPVKQIFITAFSYQQDGNSIQIKNNSYLVTNNGPVTNGLKYRWDFGDGKIDSTSRDPQHTYATARGYQVALTVTNPEDRCDATLTQPISVGCIRPATPTISKVGVGTVTDLTICNNEPLSLLASGCTQKALWFVNNRAEKIYEGSTLVVTPQLFPTSGTFQIVAQCKEGTDANPCLSELSKPLSLTITTPPTPVVKIKNNATGEFVSDNYSYTPGTALTITAQGCDGFGTIRWEVKKGNTTLTPPNGTAFIFPMVGISPAQGENYTFAAYCQQSSVSTTCESSRSNQPLLSVGSCPAINIAASSPISNSKITVCGGTELKLNATGGNGLYEWQDEKLRVVGTGSVFIPSTSGKYKAVSCQGGVVSSTITVEIISVESTILNGSNQTLNDTTVKVGSNLSLVGSDLVPPTGPAYNFTYSWEGPNMPSLTTAPYLQLNAIRANQTGTYKITVSKSLNSVTCKSSATARVVVQAADCNLKILEPVITCGTGGATLKVKFSGANPALNRQFSLNGTTYQADSTFKNLPDSTYTLYVRERVGDQSQVCQAATKTVIVFCDTTAACSFQIIAKNYSNQEVLLIPRKSNNELDLVTLSIKNNTGKALGNGITYEWSGPNNFKAISSTILINAIGSYFVKVKRGNIICIDSIRLTSSPCSNTVPISSCGTNGNFTAVPDELNNRLAALVEGDIIQAGDFEIIITKVTSGSSDGWNAKAYVVVPYMSSRITVELKNAIINNCYQLTLGNSLPDYPTIVSLFDPDFNGTISLDNIVGDVKTFLEQLKDQFNTYKGTTKEKQTIDASLNKVYSEINASPFLIPDKKNEAKNIFNQLQNIWDSYKNCNNPNVRIASAQNQSCGDVSTLLDKYNLLQQILNEKPTNLYPPEIPMTNRNYLDIPPLWLSQLGYKTNPEIIDRVNCNDGNEIHYTLYHPDWKNNNKWWWIKEVGVGNGCQYRQFYYYNQGDWYLFFDEKASIDGYRQALYELTDAIGLTYSFIIGNLIFGPEEIVLEEGVIIVKSLANAYKAADKSVTISKIISKFVEESKIAKLANKPLKKFKNWWDEIVRNAPKAINALPTQTENITNGRILVSVLKNSAKKFDLDIVDINRIKSVAMNGPIDDIAEEAVNNVFKKYGLLELHGKYGSSNNGFDGLFVDNLVKPTKAYFIEVKTSVVKAAPFDVTLGQAYGGSNSLGHYQTSLGWARAVLKELEKEPIGSGAEVAADILEDILYTKPHIIERYLVQIGNDGAGMILKIDL